MYGRLETALSCRQRRDRRPPSTFAKSFLTVTDVVDTPGHLQVAWRRCKSAFSSVSSPTPCTELCWRNCSTFFAGALLGSTSSEGSSRWRRRLREQFGKVCALAWTTLIGWQLFPDYAKEDVLAMEALSSGSLL